MPEKRNIFSTDKEKQTGSVYSLLWNRTKNEQPSRWHFDEMQARINKPIVKGQRGVEIGSGCGYDTYIMAKTNPLTKIVSLDISDGVYKTRELTGALNNVFIMKGSALDLPIAADVFDFVYSYGVLHHTLDPQRGLKEIARVLKKGAPAYLYLYEDHSENFIKYLSLKIITVLRALTTKIPSKILYVISFLVSPLVVIFFSYPHRILKKFKGTRKFAEKIPFGFGTHLFSVHGDLYDRFSAPIEHRFSRNKVFDLFSNNGFIDIEIGRMNSTAGWVVWGYKNK